MNTAEYLSQLMVARLGTSDDDSSYLITNMLLNADPATGNVPISYGVLSSDLAFEDKDTYYEFDGVIPLSDRNVQAGTAAVIVFDNESPTYAICHADSSTNAPYFGAIDLDVYPYYIGSYWNDEKGGDRWLIKVSKDWWEGEAPHHVTVFSQEKEEKFSARFTFDNLFQPIDADADFPALWLALQAGCPIHALAGNDAAGYIPAYVTSYGAAVDSTKGNYIQFTGLLVDAVGLFGGTKMLAMLYYENGDFELQQIIPLTDGGGEE